MCAIWREVDENSFVYAKFLTSANSRPEKSKAEINTFENFQNKQVVSQEYCEPSFLLETSRTKRVLLEEEDVCCEFSASPIMHEKNSICAWNQTTRKTQENAYLKNDTNDNVGENCWLQIK